MRISARSPTIPTHLAIDVHKCAHGPTGSEEDSKLEAALILLNLSLRLSRRIKTSFPLAVPISVSTATAPKHSFFQKEQSVWMRFRQEKVPELFALEV